MVVVTGASSGIGRAVALELARSGYEVLAGVRGERDGGRLAEEAPKGIIPLRLDVTDSEQVDALAEEVARHLGARGLAALINNAGINYVSPFANSDPARARHLLEVNLIGLARVSQVLLPLLRRHVALTERSAKLINVSSIGGAVGIPWEPFYHASKFAVLGLSESLRMELWRERIVVSCVMPGGIRTEFIAKSVDDMRAARETLRPDDPAHYGPALDALIKGSALVSRLGSPPEAVARAIARTLREERPRFKVLVGRDAHFLYLLSKFAPSGWRHFLLRNVFGA